MALDFRVRVYTRILDVVDTVNGLNLSSAGSSVQTNEYVHGVTVVVINPVESSELI